MQRKRKILFATISIVLFCLALSGQPIPFFKEKPEISSLPNDVEVDETKTKAKSAKQMTVLITAYYGPRPGQAKYFHGSFSKDVRINGAGKGTRSGKVPRIGTASANWKLLRRGTKFRILDCDIILNTKPPTPVKNIIFEVQDTGSKIKGKHIDIYVGESDTGRQNAEKIACRKHLIEIIN